MKSDLQRRVFAEFLGTAGLLIAVVGSGIMAERLSAGSAAVALLANSLATGAALVALILTFGPISGAHLNPVVTVGGAFQGSLAWKDVPWYVFGQGVGAVAGVLTAHVMFGLPAFVVSRHVRSGASQMLGETIATAGLLLVILLCSRAQPPPVPYAVAAYITSAYWFTSSTSFANPAVTLARSLTDTFAGIRPTDVPGFLLGEAAGTVVAIALSRLLLAKKISAGSPPSP